MLRLRTPAPGPAGVFFPLCLSLLATTWFECGTNAPAIPRAYVGAATCAKCHGGALGNHMHEDWQGTAHARAWASLEGERADSIAVEMGVTGSPRSSAVCLECHVTGHAAAPALRLAMPPEEGVSCEACHGPGADYAKKLVMPETRVARHAGLRDDPEESCVECHRPGYAHIEDFDYKARWPLIAHALPEAED